MDKPKKKRVMVNKQRLRPNLVKPAEAEIEVPELNNLMDLGEDEVSFVKVRQLTLDEYVACRNDSEDKMRNLVEGVVAAAEKADAVTEELLAAFKQLSPRGQYYVDVCRLGTVEPQLPRTTWVFLAKQYPIVVEKIASSIILLTKGGAEVKKNS
jgi:hypothetical protein